MDDLLCQEGLSKKTNVELVEIIIKQEFASLAEQYDTDLAELKGGE